MVNGRAEGAFWAPALIRALQFPSCVAKASYSTSLCLSFPVCKMGIITAVPTLYVHCTKK